ncbi:protein of unknown function [Taphrina deformans PYCC 5710]|uniref:DHHA2 domain-containing protein n=1 Tax=Taphrina deformans (strain PYCC 5710 / ATCC 11124 / CBS 356.35 / IMI 108563 / JCM 9778 / NBRC 8474) TaxID=1097556 RepID=R4XP70_TAPDE|nr:protein of unknown function [Taphrina deformans PYCC 5710]|eukprot:CCG85045.1 protein of unknown function [Taphrina deformans PYCC 5710]
MSVTSYLRSCQQALKTLTTLPFAKQNITLVVGNESADLDSCVSSIAYGYLATLKAGSGELTIPVLNLPREDIKLRAELSLLLRSVDVSEGDLVCRDELPIEVRNADRIPFVLLDHNHFKLEGIVAEKVAVKAIIDHHVDERLYLNASPRIIRPCGSCTSLVVDHFSELWSRAQMEGETQLSLMALSAILIDTSRLSNQTTETDFDIVKFLRSRLIGTQSWDESKQYKALQQAKRDVTGLSFAQLLRDYKEWDLGSDVGFWGISSITTSMDELLSMTNWQDDLETHCANRKLDVYMIMVSRPVILALTLTNQTKHGEKELLIYLVSNAKKLYYDNFIEKATTEMLLKDWKSLSFKLDNLRIFQQGELSATRKKVASICQSIKPAKQGENELSSL